MFQSPFAPAKPGFAGSSNFDSIQKKPFCPLYLEDREYSRVLFSNNLHNRINQEYA